MYCNHSYIQRLWLGCLIAVTSQAYGQVSSDGLLIEYRYETSQGNLVTSGSSAAGQIDDTGSQSNHATGSGGSVLAVPTYQAETPAGIGSNFSLNFPSPETPLNIVSIPITDGDELSSVTLDNFRVEAWFRTTDTGRSNLFSSYSGPATALNLELHTENRGRIYVQGPDAITDLNVELPEDSRDGQWHHLAGVREDGVVELYFDGEFVGDAFDDAGSFTINKPDFYLGMDGRTSGTPRFQGGLDDVRIFGSADQSSLIAEYLFETVEGAPVSDGLVVGDQVDDSGNVGPFHGIGPSAVEATSPTYVADTPSVLTNSTYSFAVDEQSETVEDAVISVSTELAEITNGDFALETWFKTTDTGRSILLGGFAGGLDTVNLELHTDNRVRIYVDGPSITDLNVTADVDTRDDEWHHLVGQRDNDGFVSLYLDGEFQGDVFDESGDFTMQVEQMFLTRDSRTGGTQFDGLIDNTRVWSRALTEEEISALAAGAMLSGRAILGDLDDDGLLTAADIDQLSAALRANSSDERFDLDTNGSVNEDDLSHMIANIFGTRLGDANLNGTVDFPDFLALSADFGNSGGWAEGDFDGNGQVEFPDFLALSGNFGKTSEDIASVPEPSSISLIVFGLVSLALTGRRHR